MEAQRADSLFTDPHHPYTAALLEALPDRAPRQRLAAIPGVVPGQWDRRGGCVFAPRCAFANDLVPHASSPRARERITGPRVAATRRCWMACPRRARRRPHERQRVAGDAGGAAASRLRRCAAAGCSARRCRCVRSTVCRSRWLPGSTLAVVGESGSGKSTLARVLDDGRAADVGPATDRRRRRRRQRRRPRGSRLRRRCRSSFRIRTARSTHARPWARRCEEPLLAQHRACRRRAAHRPHARCCARWGCAQEHFSRYPHMFSGGQRQRIAIARALMLRPQRAGARRAGVGARRLDPRAGAQPAGRPASTSWRLAYVFISHDLERACATWPTT